MVAFFILVFFLFSKWELEVEDKWLSEPSEILVEKNIDSWPHFWSAELDPLWAQDSAYLTISLGDYYHTKDLRDLYYIINYIKMVKLKKSLCGMI